MTLQIVLGFVYPEHWDSVVGGFNSGYDIILSGISWWEGLSFRWSHRGVGYRFFLLL
ncbi:MAG: hypothetical protein ACRCTQ_05640 [Brevinemataceae bacterium]